MLGTFDSTDCVVEGDEARVIISDAGAMGIALLRLGDMLLTVRVYVAG